ncbi:MFS transporter [Alcanivorax sp. N3-2A]|nr:MFS transporter [Alcanivorax sp. N3-2A]|tara:strand:- start:36349 stop:37638 length:1290 start_codon:yes stop_codon:yes gene_type:complete
MAVMDSSIVNVALPVIADNLNVSASESVWVVNAYLIAVATTLLPLSALGDIVGYRRVYLAGLALFTVFSLVCTFSDSLPMLAAARFFQGLGAAGIMSVNAALIRFIYPTRKLGKGIGISAMVVAFSTGIGPTVAAGILSVGDWPWLFAVNIPLGCVAFFLAARSLPFTPRASHRFDFLSAVLNVLGIGLLVTAIDGLSHGVYWPWSLSQIALAATVLWLLVRRQLNRSSPLLPVDLLRSRPFALAVCTSMCAFASQITAFIVLPFYLHDTLGYSPVQTGLLMTPWPAAVVVAAPIAGRLSDRYPVGALCALGLSLKLIGLLLIAALPAQPSLAALLPCMALCGLGFGFFQAPNNRAIIGAAPRHRSGGAAGMQGTARLLGQSTGAALTALAFALTGGGIVAPLLMAAGFDALAVLVSLSRLRKRPDPAV